MYYLAGIAQALIEHADLAFFLSPNNHYGAKSKMAALRISTEYQVAGDSDAC